MAGRLLVTYSQAVGLFPEQHFCSKALPAPSGASWRSEPRSQSLFLEQAGQTSGRQVLGSAPLEPGPEEAGTRQGHERPQPPARCPQEPAQPLSSPSAQVVPECTALPPACGHPWQVEC